ncbi:hypothetical protein BQ8420_09865 [Nocardiopsis sp. JB363]|nr:hypothetical protein BQ8420_09865 [Nocardiopsis sp. JB363]
MAPDPLHRRLNTTDLTRDNSSTQPQIVTTHRCDQREQREKR